MRETLTLGLVLVMMGTALRAWALYELERVGIGRNALVGVSIPNEWTTRGPYTVVRHPVYWGSLLVIAGAGVVALGYGGAVLAFAAWPYYQERMRAEDELRAACERRKVLAQAEALSDEDA